MLLLALIQAKEKYKNSLIVLPALWKEKKIKLGNKKIWTNKTESGSISSIKKNLPLRVTAS